MVTKGDYKYFPGMFPTSAGKIASNGPYEKVRIDARNNNVCFVNIARSSLVILLIGFSGQRYLQDTRTH